MALLCVPLSFLFDSCCSIFPPASSEEFISIVVSPVSVLYVVGEDIIFSLSFVVSSVFLIGLLPVTAADFDSTISVIVGVNTSVSVVTIGVEIICSVITGVMVDIILSVTSLGIFSVIKDSSVIIGLLSVIT